MPTTRGAFSIALTDFLKTFKFGDRVSGSVTDFIEKFEDEQLRMLTNIYKDLGIYDSLPDSLKPSRELFGGGVGQGGAALIGQVLGSQGANLTDIYVGGIKRSLVHLTNKANPNELLSPVDYLMYQFRHEDELEWTTEQIHKHGLDDDSIDVMRDLYWNLMPIEHLISLYLRGEIARSEVIQRARPLGWVEDDVLNFLKLAEIIPPANDLIHMLVRDAFNEDTVNRFSLDEDFRTEILPYTAAQGLSEDWTRKYWRSHWVLPSPQQAFEMYQRLRPGRSATPFDKADLQQFLLTADMPKYFRERMIEIAYRPVSRVDIRRLYKAGDYSADDVYNAYKDLGYNERDSQALSNFAIQDAVRSLADVSTAAIIKAYKKGRLSRTEAVEDLRTARVPDNVSMFYLDQADLDVIEASRDERIELLHQQYINGFVSDLQINQLLDQIGVPSTEKQLLLIRWAREKLQRVAKPGLSDIKNFYFSGVITRNKMIELIRLHNYTTEIVNMFASAYDRELAGIRLKEYNDAQENQRKLLEQSQVDERNAALARLDVSIAQDELDIANLKVAQNVTEDQNQFAAMAQVILEIQAEIKQYVLEKTQLRVS